MKIYICKQTNGEYIEYERKSQGFKCIYLYFYDDAYEVKSAVLKKTNIKEITNYLFQNNYKVMICHDGGITSVEYSQDEFFQQYNPGVIFKKRLYDAMK